jgi:hypothetical protein
VHFLCGRDNRESSNILTSNRFESSFGPPLEIWIYIDGSLVTSKVFCPRLSYAGKQLDRGILPQDYSPHTPVCVVGAAALEFQRKEVVAAISTVLSCVVLLDDAHEWYDFDEFFGLFKNTRRLLVAASTFSMAKDNKDTPVEFQKRVRSNLVEDEVAGLLNFLNVDPIYHILVPPLLTRWSKMKRTNSEVTLADTFFQAATMEDPGERRFLPELSGEIREVVMKDWRATATTQDRQKLSPYGIFDANGPDWSCEHIRRKYFLVDLFHSAAPYTVALFDTNQDLPSEKDLVSLGLGQLQWNQLKNGEGSSPSGFPVEDIWQAEFNGAIGW